jgi:hypothetical protein
MLKPHSSSAALRIFGDTLDPEKITNILGCPPTKAHVKGQIRHKTTTYKTGGWILDAGDRTPANLDAQVAELLGMVTADLTVWAALAEEHLIDVFFGYFMAGTGEDLEMSAGTMKLLSERGIRFGMSVYAPIPDLAPTDPCPCGSGDTYAECCAPKS